MTNSTARSPRRGVVVPIVLGLLGSSSVVDFGCGRGTWLRACLENGVRDVLGTRRRLRDGISS